MVFLSTLAPTDLLLQSQATTNAPSIVRLENVNRTDYPSTSVVKGHIHNSINSEPLLSTSIPPPGLPMSPKINSKGPTEERIRKRLRKAKQAVRRRRPRWLKLTMQNFSTFCNQTSIHGWQYIAQAHTSSLKHIFWALIVSLSMATAALFLYNNTMAVSYTHLTLPTNREV